MGSSHSHSSGSSSARRSDSGHPLLVACQNGDLEHLEAQVASLPTGEKASALINTLCDGNQMYGLHLACEGGHDRVVVWLLSHGADVLCRTVRGNTALHIAARSDKALCVRALLRGTNWEMWARARLLWVALRKPNDGLSVEQHGKGVDSSWLLLLLADTRQFVNLRNNEDFVALELAIKNRATTVIPLLLSQGSLRCLKGGALGSALHVAAAHGLGEQPLRLLARQSEDGINVLNQRKETPLYRACCAYPEAEDTVRVLLELGADWAITASNGNSALDEARARHYDASAKHITDAIARNRVIRRV